MLVVSTLPDPTFSYLGYIPEVELPEHMLTVFEFTEESPYHLLL